jgi:hypothetical protein
MTINDEHEQIVAYVSDYIRRYLETKYFDEHFYCRSVKNVTVDEFISSLKHYVKDHILRGV